MSRWRTVVVVVVWAALLVACGDGELPWTDDFSDPTSGWLAESDASAEVEYHDGVMRILIKAPNRLAWASAGREFSDFRLTVEATQVAGPDDNEYGVLVRMQDPDHFYCFSVSGDGYYLVSKYDGEDWEALSGADWLPSDAIYLGAATNRLEVICQGTALTFLVNGEKLFHVDDVRIRPVDDKDLVFQIEDASYRRGDIGLYAGSFFEPGVEIHFDNLRVDSP